MARVLRVQAGGTAFVKVSHRRSTLFAVPVPSSKGVALLFFAAKVRGRGSRWWSPTLALAGAPLRSLVEGLRRLAEGGRPFSFRSRKSGLFIAARRRGRGFELVLGKEAAVYVRVAVKRGDLLKLAELLEGAMGWRPAELPLPLTWSSKERIFGPYV